MIIITHPTNNTQQWKLTKPEVEELRRPRNYRPGLPEEHKPKRPDMMVVQIWYYEWDTKTRKLCWKSKSEVIWDTDWDDNAEFQNWYQRRWCESVVEKRQKDFSAFKCFSPSRWVGTKEQKELEPKGDTCPIELVKEWPMVWLGYESDKFPQSLWLRKHYQQHWEVKKKLIEECEKKEEILKDLVLQHSQHGFMLKQLVKYIRSTITRMLRGMSRNRSNQEREVSTEELISGLENTLRVMRTNATEAIRRSNVSKTLVESQHWVQRERFCTDLIELFAGRLATTRDEGQRLEGSTLGQSNALLYGGGHGPPWKGRATPLVLAGKAGARGSEQISSDCSQSVLLSCLPTGLNQCASHVELPQAHESAVSSPSS
jgi:hypothetical protein